MRFIFKPVTIDSYKEYWDWFENTRSTPERLEDGAAFKMQEFRKWMLEWVFK